MYRKKLKELSTFLPDLIRQAVKQRDAATALTYCDELRESQVLFHDFLAESCTVFWSWVGGELGEDAVGRMFRFIFQHAAERQFFAAACIDAPPHLAVLMLAKSWRAHSCFGAGEHPGRFTITEDNEKFTFHLHPCGSGLRLWRKGFYDPGAGGRRTTVARPWTYQQEGLPYYCLHCPFLNEILPYESAYGTLLWPVDPPATVTDDCAWHIYKDRAKIPARYYDRLGIRPKQVPCSRFYQPGRRYFSQAELDTMARPVPDRIREAVEKQQWKMADQLCREVQDEFLVLHDLYVNMLSATLTFIAETADEQALGRALKYQWEHCVRKLVAGHLKGMSLPEKVAFLARKIFGPDSCFGTGRQPASFSMVETDTDVIFTLDPCGSGGRLSRCGCHRPRPVTNRIRERVEDGLIGAAARFLPLPESLLEKMFPFMIGLFTQRKSYDQGLTREPHAWSFNRAGVPYFCCQCGMIADIYKESGLTITPPASANGPCIWKIRKDGTGS